MEIWIRDQINAIVAAFIMGVAFGIIYDVIRIIHVLSGTQTYSKFNREKNKTYNNKKIAGKALTFLLDVIFCSVFTVSFAILSYAFCDGRFRLFVLLSTITGFSIYIITVGRMVMYFSEVIVYYLKLAFGYVLRAVMLPFIMLARVIKRFIVFIYRHTLSLLIDKIIFLKRLRYTKKAKCKLSAAVRFEP